MRKNMCIYRGKLKDDSEWVEGFYVHLHDHKGNESHRIYPGYAETDCGVFYPDWFEVDPETVGQLTGETANDEQLFEGDIFRCDDELMVVEWSVPDSGYVAHSLDGSNWEYPLGQIHLGCAEIIGNRFDNPELLEVTDHA